MRRFGKDFTPTKSRSIMQHERAGKSNTGAPQFPGWHSGMSIEQIRKVIASQPRQTGFTFQINTGTQNLPNLKLPGDAKMLLGLNWNAFLATDDDAFTFTVNNNKIIDNASVILNSTSQTVGSCYAERPYIPMWQPLSGQDSLEISYTQPTGRNTSAQLVLWYV